MVSYGNAGVIMADMDGKQIAGKRNKSSRMRDGKEGGGRYNSGRSTEGGLEAQPPQNSVDGLGVSHPRLDARLDPEELLLVGGWANGCLLDSSRWDEQEFCLSTGKSQKQSGLSTSRQQSKTPRRPTGSLGSVEDGVADGVVEGAVMIF